MYPSPIKNINSKLFFLFKTHLNRFRIGAVINNDNVLSKVSRRFRLTADAQQAPRLTPQLKTILPLGPQQLSVQWVLAENATVKQKIEVNLSFKNCLSIIEKGFPLHFYFAIPKGYFINFRPSTSAGPYSHLTIFGAGTHSHILDNLKPGESYDIKVRERVQNCPTININVLTR